jgi:hypothetical protein
MRHAQCIDAVTLGRSNAELVPSPLTVWMLHRRHSESLLVYLCEFVQLRRICILAAELLHRQPAVKLLQTLAPAFVTCWSNAATL